jgi:transcriptional regulator with XRE-family HTH domain
MRTAGGWTLGRLAQQAGVSKMALSRWEAGTRLPRIPELEAVLNALNVNAAQRAQIFSNINAPRGVQHLRAAFSDKGFSAPPLAGDLLRAMRLRKGWTQAQAATAVHVTQATVARWGRGERLPDTQQVQSLCYALGAQEQELLALTTGRFSNVPQEEPRTWQEAYADVDTTLRTALQSFVHGLGDLFFLSLERKALRWAMEAEKMQPLLARTYVWHGQFLRNVGRLGEVEEWVRRARKLASPKEPDVYLRAVVLSGTAAVYSGSRITPERGLRVLSGWAERSPLPEFSAWILSDSGKYATLSEQKELALTFAKQAADVARRSDNPTELFLRRCDLARALLELNRPYDALNALPLPDEDEGALERTDALLLWSEAHWKAEHLMQAHDTLQKAMHLIETHNIEAFRARADAQAAHF